MAHYCVLLTCEFEFVSSFAFFVQLQTRVAFYPCFMRHNLERKGDPGLVDPGLVDPGLVDPGLVDPGLVDPGLVDPGLVDLRMSDLWDYRRA